MTGFGLADVKPYFWLIDGASSALACSWRSPVDTRDDVATFYRAALDVGAFPLNPSAVHPEYHADYYGAFVPDPQS